MLLTLRDLREIIAPPRGGTHADNMNHYTFRRARFAAAGVGAAVLVFLGANTVAATTRTVVSLADSGTGSLRQAMADAVNGDTINFSVTGTITITSGPLNLSKSLTITGPGARKLNLSASANVIPTIAVTGGSSTISGLTIGPGGNGMNLENVGVAMTLNDCTISNNTFGGGIFTNIGTTLTMNGCTVSGNRDDSVNVPVKYGSGVINEGTATLTNCTIANNTPNGLANLVATMTLKSCSVTQNNGVGIFAANTTVNLTNTVVSGNNGTAAAPDISGFFVSNGYNVIAKKDGGTGFTNGVNHDVVGTAASPRDALLTPLLNNGGPTDTCAIFASASSAFNAGNPATAPARDQRGFLRPDTPDAGACEFLGTQPVTLANISSRAVVQSGNDVLIGGFIITGGQKLVLLRAIGPSLNLPGKLSDPTLELYLGNQLLSTNDNWGTAANHVEIMNTGAAPTNAAESAILSSLSPGSYTFIVRGAGGATGIGVVEAYDLDRAVGSRLANISTRAAVQTGDNVLIGGFIVLGPDSLSVIVRGIGPSLLLQNRMLDPTLELHDGNGGTLASNDNWRATQEAAIIATTVPPVFDAEPAIVATLPPGNYTAILRGANNTTGVAVVEVYGLL